MAEASSMDGCLPLRVKLQAVMRLPQERSRKTRRSAKAGWLVQDAVASATQAFAHHVAGLMNGRNTGHGSAVHAADSGRLPDARLVGAGNSASHRAYCSASGSSSSGMFAYLHLVGITLTIGEIDLILFRVDPLHINNRTAWVLNG